MLQFTPCRRMRKERQDQPSSTLDCSLLLPLQLSPALPNLHKLELERLTEREREREFHPGWSRPGLSLLSLQPGKLFQQSNKTAMSSIYRGVSQHWRLNNMMTLQSVVSCPCLLDSCQTPPCVGRVTLCDVIVLEIATPHSSDWSC